MVHLSIRKTQALMAEEAAHHFTEALKHLTAIQEILNRTAISNAITFYHAVPFLAQLRPKAVHQDKVGWAKIALFTLVIFCFIFTMYLVGYFVLWIGVRRDILHRYDIWKKDVVTREKEEQREFLLKYGHDAVKDVIESLAPYNGKGRKR